MKPNLLLITTDQHNADIIGAYGNPVVRTPHLDELAAHGVLLSNAFTPHPVCTPARTSLFTGLLGSRHGVTYNINLSEERPDPPHWLGLDAGIRAFPERLRDAGYDTSFFGKLHTQQQGGKAFGLTTLKLAEGKGHFTEDRENRPDDYRRHLRAKGYPESAWRTWENPGYREAGHTVSPLPAEDYIDVWTATQAIEHLEGVREPFFSWVSFSGPHTPWDPPRPYDRFYDPAEIPLPHRRPGELEEKAPAFADAIARTIPATPPRSSDPSREGGIANAYWRFPERMTREMLAAYYAQVTLIDEQIGRILDLLRAQGRLENTLILFTADHGDYCGDNYAFYKLPGLYPSLIRVPLLARWDRGLDACGTRRDALTSLVDVAPTFLEAAGIAPDESLDGRSLLPLARGEAADWRSHLTVSFGQNAAVVTDRHLFTVVGGFEELYDRHEDPHCLRNLRACAGEALVEELRGLLPAGTGGR